MITKLKTKSGRLLGMSWGVIDMPDNSKALFLQRGKKGFLEENTAPSKLNWIKFFLKTLR